MLHYTYNMPILTFTVKAWTGPKRDVHGSQSIQIKFQHCTKN
jgi:hypothetical protein